MTARGGLRHGPDNDPQQHPLFNPACTCASPIYGWADGIPTFESKSVRGCSVHRQYLPEVEAAVAAVMDVLAPPHPAPEGRRYPIFDWVGLGTAPTISEIEELARKVVAAALTAVKQR